MKSKAQIKTEMILHIALELAGDNVLNLEHYRQATLLVEMMGIK